MIDFCKENKINFFLSSGKTAKSYTTTTGNFNKESGEYEIKSTTVSLEEETSEGSNKDQEGEDKRIALSIEAIEKIRILRCMLT